VKGRGEAAVVQGGAELVEDQVLEETVDVSRQWAYRAMRVAREFNAEMAARFGIEKLNAAVAYLEATRAEEQPGDILATDLRVRGEEGRFEKVPFVEATQAQVWEAVELLGEAKVRRVPVPKEVGQRAKALEKALPPAPQGLKRGARVRLSRGKDGRLAATFRAIPLDELEQFVEALRAHLAEGDD